MQESCIVTVQLRYKRTTHTRIIRTYFAYSRMSIRAHMRVYTCVYVSLLCIPISFFMWGIVCQTKDIILLGMKNASKRNMHIVKTSCRSMKAIIFRVFDHFANSPTNHRLLTLAWSLAVPKMGRKLKQSLELPVLTRELYVFTRKDLCFRTCRQVVCEMFILSVFNILVEKLISPFIFDTDHSFNL